MIKTIKKEFVCNSCSEDRFELDVAYSKADKEICRDCAYAQKRHNIYFSAGMADQFYSNILE